ncbi:late embryogenesis abundant protein, LEA-14 [Artemisia annua]|uniref:Late embryogenesis abundant protein, LEA-14 n=1 Tax=Artemisia annua TaxID=35608 RepID=A0A2U1PW23_ARTAN|nr:late embryogenesis abundant protein, LEA-14 [Artemisia annua]
MAKARGASRQSTDNAHFVLARIDDNDWSNLLIIWATLKPRKPVFIVTGASINKYMLSKDHHLDASYTLDLYSFNPDKKMSIQYKKLDVTIMFEDETVANGVISSWHQHSRKKWNYNLDLASQNVELSSALSQHLELAKSSNKVALSVMLKGKIRSKMGIWRSKYYHMKVSCLHLMVPFSNSSGRYQGTLCDVDI